MEDYREIFGLMDKIHMMRKIFVNQNGNRENRIYFGQLPILEFVILHPGCTQKDIADFVKVTPASIALSTKRLQKAGMIEKKVDRKNLRNNCLYATMQGRELSLACRGEFDALDRQTFSGFSQDEIRQFRSYLDRMMDNVAPEGYRQKDFFSLLAIAHELRSQSEKEQEK